MTEKETFDETNKKARRSRKISEAALLLPVIGTILLLTPILKIFPTNNEVSPLINSMLFIFGVWAVLISAAFILSRLLIPEIRDK